METVITIISRNTVVICLPHPRLSIKSILYSKAQIWQCHSCTHDPFRIQISEFRNALGFKIFGNLAQLYIPGLIFLFSPNPTRLVTVPWTGLISHLLAFAHAVPSPTVFFQPLSIWGLPVPSFCSQWQKPTNQLWLCVGVSAPSLTPSQTSLLNGQGHVLLDQVVRMKGPGLKNPTNLGVICIWNLSAVWPQASFLMSLTAHFPYLQNGNNKGSYFMEML